jgi:pyruvate formate lyase activating enzyme
MKFGGWQRCSLIDFPGKVSAVLFTQGCSFRCPFCHNPGLVIPAQFSDFPISEEEILSFLENRKGKLDGVVISGGEPTLHQDLPTFIRKVRSLGFKIKLDSNGSRPDVVEALIKENLVDYWAIDRKASLARYPQITGIAIDTKLIAKTSQLIMDSTTPYEFRSTLIREYHPPEEVECIAKELSGAKQLILQQFRPAVTLDPKFQKATPYSDEEMGVLLSLVKPHVHTCSWR